MLSGVMTVELTFSGVRAKGGAHVPLQLEVPPPDLSQEGYAMSPLQFRGHARYEDGAVALLGTLRFTVTRLCVRCLKPFTETIESELQERFVHGTPPLSEETVENADFEWIPTDEIPLMYILQEWARILPDPFGVCKKDCKGLCPVCGTDLNIETCSCETETIDPRLAGLKAFFEKR